MLNMIINEGKLGEIPLSFNYCKLSRFFRSSTMKKEKMKAGLKSLGYKMVASYISPGFYKSTASMSVIYDIIKAHKIEEVG